MVRPTFHDERFDATTSFRYHTDKLDQLRALATEQGHADLGAFLRHLCDREIANAKRRRQRRKKKSQT